MLNNVLILGNIYDPDTDCQYVLLRVHSKDWEDYEKELDEESLDSEWEEIEDE